jgi:hypothetical protein
MPGFDGTGPRGMGPMTGGGRGNCNPRGAGIGRRNFPVSRRASNAYPRSQASGSAPLPSQMSREQELEFLKEQAKALRDELNEIEAGIKRLSS